MLCYMPRETTKPTTATTTTTATTAAAYLGHESLLVSGGVVILQPVNLGDVHQLLNKRLEALWKQPVVLS